MKYKASKDMTVKIITAVIIVLFLFLVNKSVIGLIHSNGNLTSLLIHSSVVVLLLATLFYGYLYAPKGYFINSENVVIDRPLNDVFIPIDSIIEVRPVGKFELKGTIKTFGVGGLFGNYGKYYSNELNNYNLYGTQSKNYVLIKTKGKKYVITPDDIGFVDQVKEILIKKIEN